MAGYFGSELQQALQAKCEAAWQWSMETPGACNSGRLVGTDDPERLGWDLILRRLAEDGAFSFRMLPVDVARAAVERLKPAGYRLDLWDVFMAGREAASPNVDKILASGLPHGFSEMPVLTDGASREAARMQAFMAAQGISPFSGSLLAGEFGSVVTIRIADADGELAATAHGYMPHNRYSPLNRSAWAGLVAVAPKHRSLGLGTFVTAGMMEGCFSILDAETVHAFASTTNMPSRRMLEACGLRHEPGLTGGIAVTGAERFTR
ncbi:MAG: GNAT family N-acetyltransferase [Rhizobiaceae bacterium]